MSNQPQQPETAAEFIEQIFQQVANLTEVDAASLHIWGGQFADDAEAGEPAAGSETTGEQPAGGKEGRGLGAFLSAWAAQGGPVFQWAMVEEVSRFRVETADLGSLTQRQEQIERLRLFGPGGDLDIRRDAETFYWRFISETVTTLPALTGFKTASFWEANKDSKFARHEQQYYLWRREKNEQRVGHAWATDTAALTNETYLQQVHYLDNGRVAFVRNVDFQ